MSGEQRIAVNTAEDLPGADLSKLQPILHRAVRATLEHEEVTDASISVTLLNDARISALNEQYLEHEGPTDVISFPLFQSGEPPVGDIYIGYDQAKRQAAELSVDLEAELARLAIHGTLHVLGYDHAEDGAREGSEMWQVQEAILRQVLAS